jgi:hypothetical protein
MAERVRVATVAKEMMRYSVQALNISRASENKIHDDAVAQKLGFAGGLVPGVEVYAYACHAAVAFWGRTWLERGRMDCRFLKPLYDGRIAIVTAQEADGELELRVESDGVLCATGRAALSAGALPPHKLADYQTSAPPPNRPPANETTLARGVALGIAPFRVTQVEAREYLLAVRETDVLYGRENLIHPGLVLRTCNFALRDNVVLGPWMHTGSGVQNFAAAVVGDVLSVRARVAANYERKGHRLVDIDALVIANDERVLAHVLHTAIYLPRQLAAAHALSTGSPC